MIILRRISVVLIIAALTACTAKKPPQPEASAVADKGVVSRPGVSVRTEILRRMPLSSTISINGQVVSEGGAQAALAFPTEGQLASVNASVGDRVQRGQVLATLDARVANSAVRQAQADLTAANASLTRAAAGARAQEIGQNQAIVAGSQAKAETARAELRRQESLAQAGISSQRDLEQARSNYADSLASLRSQEAQGSLLKAGPRPQDVALARAQVQQAQAALDAAKTRASLLNLIAPFDGIVAQRLQNPGETVSTSTVVLRLVDPSRSLVEAQASEDQASLIRAGARATISTAGSPRAIPARVIATGTGLGAETQTLTVRVRPDYSVALVPGSSAKATIEVQSLSDAFVVPESSIVKDPDTGAPLIYIETASGKYRRIAVRLLLTSGQRVAIVGSGLVAGQRVVTQGSYELLPFAAGSGGD